VPVKDIASNSFSFSLKNVSDEIPQRVLPHGAEPILTLIRNEAHDDVLSLEGDGVQLVSDTRSPVASVSPLSLVDHDVVQDKLNDELLTLFLLALPPICLRILLTFRTWVRMLQLLLEVSAITHIDGSDGATDGDNTAVVIDGENNPSLVRAEGMRHSNPHIQKDLDLWQKIKEYDQRAFKNSVIVLSIEHDVVHGNIASDIVVTDMEQTAPLPLDTQTVAHATKTTANDDTYVEIMNDNTMLPVRITPAKHREVQISKNVYSDLDLWARILEYD